jgi:hypothetical protein
VRSYAKASFAAPTPAGAGISRLVGLVCVVALGLVAFLGSGAPAAVAADTCPNAVFRAGAGSKLPECRAFELVTPAYTGGLPPNFESFLDASESMFSTTTVSPSGNSVVYHLLGGGLSGFPATGYIDRYRARRTAQGWVSELHSPGGDMRGEGKPGGVSPDLEYAVDRASEPTAKLWPAFAGFDVVDVLRTPQGFEPLARGSLGDFPNGDAKWISPGGDHIVFDMNVLGVKLTKLEPNAAESGRAIYDRSVGGPTHVVSLLPNGVAAENPRFLSVTEDGTEVAFDLNGGGNAGATLTPLYVRRDNAVTLEVARPNGVVVGKELKCTGGPDTASLTYQWLRNGAVVGGATGQSYTTTADDGGAVVQCRVTATDPEGTALRTSEMRIVEPYQGNSYPSENFPRVTPLGEPGQPIARSEVGAPLLCAPYSLEQLAGTTLSYQWLREGSPIGATGSTYTPVEADIGGSLQCLMTLSGADGVGIEYTNPVSIYRPAPKATAEPAISNLTAPGDSTPAVGNQLSCSPGTWSGSPSFAYQWLRDGGPIAATGSTYTTVPADEGMNVQCQVTATDSGGSTAAVGVGVVVDPQPGTAPPQQTVAGSVTGGARVGGTLFCGEGEWTGEPTFARQWLRNGEEIAGAASFAYEPTAADVGAVVQCRLTAGNAGGNAVAIESDNPLVVTRAVPDASASIPFNGKQFPSLTFDGVFNGRVFYTDADSSQAFIGNDPPPPADLYVYDLNEEKTTRITDTEDARFVNVSKDGSHVYFISKSLIDGQGSPGSFNLGVYSVDSESFQFIATVSEADVNGQFPGRNQSPGLAQWPVAINGDTIGSGAGAIGRAVSHTRSTPDGTVLAFESSAQLSAFDNKEENPDDCDLQPGNFEDIPGERCVEVYRYDTVGEELTCVSCGPGLGPATGNARLQSINVTGVGGVEPATAFSPVESLTADGSMVFFESTEGLVARDGNETRDVYRWKEGEGVDLISTGQSLGANALYAVTPSGSDVIFATREQLLPGDENGTTARFYDARVGGGFPPPEESVTEPCAGDACQGQAGAAPPVPPVVSSALSGEGNVHAKVRCRKHFRRVVRKGKERCVRRKHSRPHRRAHHKSGRAAL